MVVTESIRPTAAIEHPHKHSRRYAGRGRVDAHQRKMDVPTHDTIGLNIYRELVGRENRSVGTWEKRYGKKVAVLP